MIARDYFRIYAAISLNTRLRDRLPRFCSLAPWLLCTAPVEWHNGKKFGDTICLWQRKNLPHRVGDPRRALEKNIRLLHR